MNLIKRIWLIAFIANMFLCNISFAQGNGITVKQYEREAISLYKELRLLKNKGLLYNDCGVGACAPKEVKEWYKKWKLLNNKRPTDGFPDLRMTDNNSVSVGDLYDIVTNAYSDKGKAAMYQYEVAMICYDHPTLCKKYQ